MRGGELPRRPGRSGEEPRRPARPAGGRSTQFRIVYEDEDLIVVDKPAGLLSATPPGQTSPSLFNMLRERASARGRRGRVWIIHRLDREASGLLVFAKSERAFEWLKEDIRTRRTNRQYLALVEGEIGAGGEGPEQGRDAAAGAPVTRTVQSHLREDSRGRVRSIAPGAFRGGDSAGRGEDVARPAITHYRVEGSGGGYALLRVWLQTGRKHQVRVHLSESGHPITGDREYGAQANPLGRLGLHAVELSLDHPQSGQRMRFVSPAPGAFYRAIGARPPAVPVERAPPEREAAAAARGWDHVAEWYDELIEEKRSDHFERVILPGVLRLLRPQAGMRLVDVACGQGTLCRAAAGLGADVLGIDASPRLVEAARARGGGPQYEVADARTLEAMARERGWAGRADAAACVMALMNIEPVEPVLRGVAAVLREGGAFVAVILHPAFRAPGQTSWGWDEQEKERRTAAEPDGSERGERARQYRRVDGYLSAGEAEIVMNPGAAAHGRRPVTTTTHHRPIQTYVKACAEAGLLLDALEEWPSLRQSEPGPRAAEENRARREIPMFLALRGRRLWT